MIRRWKINSIRFGPRVVAIIGLLTLAAPAVLYLCYSVLGFLGIKLKIILSAVSISFAAGVALLGLFVLLLGVEFVQDRSRDRQYKRTRMRKLEISEGWYECQACGNQLLRAEDKACDVCGQRLI